MKSVKAKINYGFLGISLGFMALPLYVYLPKYYTQEYGVSLLALSIILFLTRFIDIIQDPLIGWVSDKWVSSHLFTRHQIVIFSLPLLAFSFLGLLLPVYQINIYLWLIFFFIASYTFLSFIMVNYYTLSAELTSDYNQQTSFVSYREGMGLLGIAIGSVVPTMLQQNSSPASGHLSVWFVFMCFLLLGASFFYLSPRPHKHIIHQENFFKAVMDVFKNKPYLLLLVIYFLSMVAASFPATIVLFYIQDVLQLEGDSGLFLLVYFLSAFCGLPFWFWLSSQMSKKQAWMIGMALTCVSFIFAAFLSQGAFWPFLTICMITGFCLSADLTMPMSLLADVLLKIDNKAKFYGVWGMINKSSLALAGSFSLLLLYMAGYEPGENVTILQRNYLALTYAFVPSLIKLGSLFLLWTSELDLKRGSMHA